MQRPSLQAGVAVFAAGALISLVLHASMLSVLARRAALARNEPRAVKVKIVERPPPPKVEEPPPPKPEEIKKPKPPPKKKEVATERKPPAEPAKEPPKPIQGLTPESMDPNGKGISAPLGNTLMTEDTGERVKEAPPPMDVDLSADPVMMRDTFVLPAYTDAALDASFTGTVLVEVLVDENGNVTEAELAKKVGFGMDARILAAAKATRFTPRKNKLGKPEAGWSRIKVNMEIP